jgi:hypothetical protein
LKADLKLKNIIHTFGGRRSEDGITLILTIPNFVPATVTTHTQLSFTKFQLQFNAHAG